MGLPALEREYRVGVGYWERATDEVPPRAAWTWEWSAAFTPE